MLCVDLNTRLLTGSHCLCVQTQPPNEKELFSNVASVKTFMFQLLLCNEVMAKKGLELRSLESDHTFISTLFLTRVLELEHRG